MKVNCQVQVVCEGEIITFVSLVLPKVGETVMLSPKLELRYTKVVPSVTISNPESEVQYYVCTAERVSKRKIVGINQVEKIDGDSYDEMFEKLNNFLYDHRHDYNIVDITHVNGFYIAITYNLRNEAAIYASKEKEKRMN